MATTEAPVLTFDCAVEVKGNVKTIVSPQGGKRLPLDLDKINAIAVYDDESAILDKMKVWGGKCNKFPMTFTLDELTALKELVKRAEAPIAPETPETIVPEAPPVIVPTPIAPAAPVLATMEHHTATVTGAECEDDEEYTGGPKKRNRKKDERVRAIAKSVTARMRGIGLDEMERRVDQLEKAQKFFDEEIEEVQYDIPEPIRAEISEPTRVIRSVGGVMVTESVAMVKEKDIPLLKPYFDVLDDYVEGTPNAIRLGCFAYYDHIGVAFKSRQKLKQRVSRTTDHLLREAHTSLINAIGKADDALKAAMGSENKTLREMELAQAGCDNAYRTAIRNAAEKLNVALMHCEAYDVNMETRDLFKAIHAAVESQCDAFNADCIKRKAKGVTI